MFLACLTIVPMALLLCLCASDIEIGVAGLRSLAIFLLMWIGFRAWILASSGCCVVVLLHSCLILASLPICLRPDFDIGGLSCVVLFVSCFGLWIGQI